MTRDRTTLPSKIPPGTVLQLPQGWEELTEDYWEHWTKLFDVLQAQIDQRFPEGPPGEPWDPGNVDAELQFKNALLWTGVEWTDPTTGKTPLRSYVEREVRDPRLAEALLWNEHPVHGSWRINRFVDGMVELEEEGTGKVTRASILQSFQDPMFVGWTVTGQLYRWGEGLRLAGVMSFRESPESVFARTGLFTSPEVFLRRWERAEVERAESVVLKPSDPPERIYARFPSHWVEGMARTLGLKARGKKREKACQIAAHLHSIDLSTVIEKLSIGSLAALRWLESEGWESRLGSLDRLYSTQVGLFWNSSKPTSPVGELRVRGLVVVGRVRGPGARLFRTAFVPVELRPRLERCLRSGNLQGAT